MGRGLLPGELLDGAGGVAVLPGAGEEDLVLPDVEGVVEACRVFLFFALLLSLGTPNILLELSLECLHC